MAITDIKDAFNRAPQVFDPNSAQGLDAVFQFDITGEGGGVWNVVIKDNTCTVQEGTHDSPSVKLTMSGETWLAMVNRELTGMEAFMDGRLQVNGDIMLAQRIPEIFPF
jgi:putative sterol carrier protein